VAQSSNKNVNSEVSASSSGSSADRASTGDPVRLAKGDQLSEGAGSTEADLSHTQVEVYDMDEERLAGARTCTTNVSDAISDAGSSTAQEPDAAASRAESAAAAAAVALRSDVQTGPGRSGGWASSGTGMAADCGGSGSNGGGGLMWQRGLLWRALGGGTRMQTAARGSAAGCGVVLVGWLIAGRQHRAVLAAVRFLLKVFRLYREMLLYLN
jgi:hypothetical protein